MDFDYIEGLTQEQLTELYSDVIEGEMGEMISSQHAIWSTICSNGLYAYYVEFNAPNNYPVGFGAYATNGYNHGSITEPCGVGRYGYTQLVGVVGDTGSMNGTIFFTKCSNGRTMYYLEVNSRFPSGSCAYDTNTWTHGSITTACGAWEYGYTCVSGYLN